MTRRLRYLLALPAVVVALTCPQAAPAGGDDNAAVAINQKEGGSRFRFAWSLQSVRGDVVDQHNTAYADSQCEHCETTAIAFQVVLVMGTPSTVTPQNLAIAYNHDCSFCSTLASAYQFVVGRGYPVRLTADGHQALERIRHGLEQLKSSDLGIVDLQARIDAYADQVRSVLATELVRTDLEHAEPPAEDGVDTAAATAGPQGSATQALLTQP